MKKILFFVFFIFASTAFAQQYSFINYSIEDGLPHTQVSALFQDDKGYLWIGTTGGIAKYDGQKFQNFSTEDGMLDNQINTIVQDKNGDIWIGTLGGIMKWNVINGFKNFPFPENNKNFNAKAIAFDDSGNPWVGTDGSGVATIKEGQYVYYTVNDGLVHDYVRAIIHDGKGNLLIGTRNGVSLLSEGKLIPTQIPELKKANVSSMMKAKSDEIWVTTFGEGAFCIKPSGAVKNYTIEDGLVNNWLRDVVEGSDHSFWFVSKFGLSHLEIDDSTYSFDDFTEKNGMPYENTQTALVDLEGNLWLGSDGGGVLRFAGESFVNFTTEDGLPEDIVMSIIEDKEKKLWFSTYSKGVVMYDRNNFTNYTTKQNLPNNTVWCSTADPKGNIWFGTSEGIAKYNEGTLKSYQVEDGLLAPKNTSIYASKDGLVYIGGKDGLNIWKNDTFFSILADGEKMGKSVRSIVEGDAGEILFGTSNGVFVKKGSKFFKLKIDSLLIDETVYSIVKDKKGNAWFGTKNGIVFYNGKNSKIYKVRPDYASNFINFILLDKNHDLWVGSNNGIYKTSLNNFYKNKELKFQQFGMEEGIKSLECNLNACYEDHEGFLWFGTSKGLIRHQPSKLKRKEDEKQPIVHITDVRLYFEKPDWDNYKAEIGEVGLPVSLKVPYKQNHFTFDFVGMYLTSPKSVRYKFKLEGFDEEWSPPTKADFATYSNLPFGDYTFKLIASSNGVYNKDEYASFSFSISPPYWRTWWFYALCAVFVILIGVMVYLWRLNIRKGREEKQLLQYKSKMLMLEQQTLNASMNRHFVFNALNSIQYYINVKDQRSANKYLTDFAKLIRLNLDSSQADTIPLSDEIERLTIYLALEHMRFPEKFDYTINVDNSIPVDDIMVPSMLLQPFVENSIIHGVLPKKEKGKVEVNIENQTEHIALIVKDDGIGIEESILSKDKNSGIGHTSKGMSITKGRIELIRKINSRYNILVEGPFEVKDINNQPSGTEVRILIPSDSNLDEKNA